MTCRRIGSLLPDYLGRQLALPVMAQVRDHLAGCPHCSAELAALQKLLALAALDKAPAMPIGEDEFLRATRSKLGRKSESGRFGSRASIFGFPPVRLVPFLAAAAVLVVVGVSMLAHRARIRTESNYAPVLAERESPDLLDLAGSESELVRDLDTATVAAMQSELTGDADVDELVEELTPRQQEQLVIELTRLYGGPNAQLSGG